MRNWLVGGALLMAVAAAGCGRSVACRPVQDGVGVCLDGAPVAWTAGVMKPHMHEDGGYYGPVEDLARALGVKAAVTTDKQSVSVGGKRVTAMAANAKGIHQHGEKVYAPIKEFAEAAGYLVEVDAKKHTINIHQ